jgi:hypothetical protein
MRRKAKLRLIEKMKKGKLYFGRFSNQGLAFNN